MMPFSSLRPRLGQHFLTDPAVAPLMVRALKLKRGDTVVEIGPGKGALTLPLLAGCESAGCRIVAIEKDSLLAKNLVHRCADRNQSLAVVREDALTAIPELVQRFIREQIPYMLTGNIPYYITGRLLRIISELPILPARAVFTVQREVAERIAARPPRMNLLAATVQFWGIPMIIRRLPRTAFIPPPRVESAVITIEPAAPRIVLSSTYYRFVKALFAHPRKTIRNNLVASPLLAKGEKTALLELLREGSLAGNGRPSEIPLPVLINLASRLEAKL